MCESEHVLKAKIIYKQGERSSDVMKGCGVGGSCLEYAPGKSA